MFLHLSVILFTVGGGDSSRGWVFGLRGMSGLGEGLLPAGVSDLGVCVWSEGGRGSGLEG